MWTASAAWRLEPLDAAAVSDGPTCLMSRRQLRSSHSFEISLLRYRREIDIVVGNGDVLTEDDGLCGGSPNLVQPRYGGEGRP